MNNRLLMLSFCASMATAVAYAGATGPVYPAPGNNSFSSSGDQARAGGKTNNYGSFDFSQFGSLYWGPDNPSTDGNGVQNVTNSGGPSGFMNFFGANGGSYEWDSSSNWNFSSAFYGNLSLPTRFLLTFSGAETTTTKAAAMIASGQPLEAVAQVSGNFSANFIFEAETSLGVWQPVLDFYDSAHCVSNCGVVDGATFGFWSTSPAAATPEPSGYAFVMVGLIGLVAVTRRYLSV